MDSQSWSGSDMRDLFSPEPDETPDPTPSRATLRARVERLFKARPGQWVDANDLAAVGGRFAWRTRVSELRREQGMPIENRTRRVTGLDGSVYTVSEYRWVP